MILSGAQGFLGQALLNKLPSAVPFLKNILDLESFKSFLTSLPDTPKIYFHFAGISSVKECADNPGLCQKINSDAPAEIAKVLWEVYPHCVFVFPSTAHVYAEVDGELFEDSSVDPKTFYAQSKLDGEFNLKKRQYECGGRLAILRLFNHTHKSQPAHFFLPSMYQQILLKDQIDVGNLEIERDMGAVQDLIAALKILSDQSDKIKETMVFNICSGVAKNLKQLVMILSQRCNKLVELQIDNSRVRTNEPKSIVGNCNRFQTHFSWSPYYGKSAESLIDAFVSDLI